jgi:hypothetical protein
MDDLITAFNTSCIARAVKTKSTHANAGIYMTLWNRPGNPSSGSPSANLVGAVPVSTTVGAIPLGTTAAGETRYLLGARAFSNVAGNIILYDRLWHNSSVTMSTVLTASTSSGAGNVVTVTRPTTVGINNELWLEFITGMGATASTLTITYTNQDGTTGRQATYSHGAAAEQVDQMVRLNLQGSDVGVRTIEAWQGSITLGTAGSCNIVILRRLAEMSIGSTLFSVNYDFAQLGMPTIDPDASLGLMVYGLATAAANVFVDLTIGVK